MSKYFVKPIVCDYGVYEYGKKEMICMCNIRTNAEIIADVLNADSDVECAHYYPDYPHAKFICRKKVNEVTKNERNCNYIEPKDINELKPIIKADKEYEVEAITRGNCMMCGKELTEGLFFCKECEDKTKKEGKK